jgi:hypothetical protein
MLKKDGVSLVAFILKKTCQFIIFQNEFTLFYNIKAKGKVVPVLNRALRHEDVWGSGGIAPRIP